MRRKGISGSSDALLFVDSSSGIQKDRRKPNPLPLIAIAETSRPDISVSTALGFSQTIGSYVRRVGMKAFNKWFVALAIAWTFFIDDLRMALLPRAADIYVDVTLLLCFVFFAVDICYRVFRMPNYVWSLYFFLDLLATAAIVGDVQSIISAAVPTCMNSIMRDQKAVGKAARLGGNCLRLLRFIRMRELVRSERIARKRSEEGSPLLPEGAGASVVMPDAGAVQILVAAQANQVKSTLAKMNRQSTDTPRRRRKSKKSGTLGRLYHMQNAPKTTLRKVLKNTDKSRESNISKRMSSRVVTLVALTVLAISVTYSYVTDVSGMTTQLTSFEYGLDLVLRAQGTSRYDEIVATFVKSNSDSSSLDYMVWVDLGDGFTWGDVPSDLRASEQCSITKDSAELVVSYRRRTRLLAIFSLCRTVVLCVVMTSMVIVLNADITNLLVFPLERMMETVTSLAQNPQNLFKSPARSFRELAEDRRMCFCVQKDFAHGEIRVLENAFRKIGVMLALVYGSAGSEMITNSIKFEGEFTPMARGREILAIFCFAKVAYFDELLEALGVSILKYVNQISRLVHSQSEKYMGSVNKNLGDSFLLAWKFPDEDGIVIQNKFVVNAHSETVQQTTSLALVFAIKTLAKVAKSQSLKKYQNDEKVKKVMKGFSSKLTFGFHVGWAYEGPIGSYFKIDASYLSPNVNIASRVESASKTYGVHILVSEEFFLRLDPMVQPFLRHIDTVLLKGVETPLKLFAFDLSTVGLGISDARPTKRKMDRKKKRLKEALITRLIFVHELFTQSDEIAHMRRQYKPEFFSSYASALTFYLVGSWRDAGTTLTESCLALVPLDGPAHSVLQFMREHNFHPPADWNGVRELLYK